MREAYTLGYGGRSLNEFLELINYFGVEAVVDVRRWNTSRRNPDFNGRNLEAILNDLGLTYMWVPELGGYRRFGVDVLDHGLAKCFEAEGFRAYATYVTMRNDVKPYLEMLLEVFSTKVSVLICREKIPWLCHRKILSDYLVAKGFRVLHVISRDRVVEHKLSKCAVVSNGELMYV